MFSIFWGRRPNIQNVDGRMTGGGGGGGGGGASLGPTAVHVYHMGIVILI